MLSRIGFVLLIGCLLFCLPLHVAAMEKDGFSPDVAAFLEKEGMTVYEDPEIKVLQAEIAEYGQKKNLTAKEREQAAALIDRLLSSIERISSEYMSGGRVAKKPVHTVQDKKELPSCVDDGSCNKEKSENPAKQPQMLKQKQPNYPAEQIQQSQQPTAQKNISFGEMLNANPTGSLDEIRKKLKL